MLPIHHIKCGRGMQNVRRRAYKSGIPFNRQIAYWKTVYVNVRRIRGRLVTLIVFKNRLPTSACLIERVADRLINFQALVKKKGKSVLTTPVLQRIFSTTRTTVLSRERSLTVLLSREKGCQFFQMAHRGQICRVCKLVYHYYGSQAVEHFRVQRLVEND